MAEVRLVDLEVIKRFSLAVRQEFATADALLAALDADRAMVLAAIDDERPPTPTPARVPAVKAVTPTRKKPAVSKKQPPPVKAVQSAKPAKTAKSAKTAKKSAAKTARTATKTAKKAKKR